MVLFLPHHLHATRSTMQRLPDFQKHSLLICPPLPVPEAQLLDALRGQAGCPLLVFLEPIRPTVGEAVQLHRKAGRRTVEIQEVPTRGMLTTKLEPGETSGPQGAPQLCFFLGWIASKDSSDGSRVHKGDANFSQPHPATPLPFPLPTPSSRGEGDHSRAPAGRPTSKSSRARIFSLSARRGGRGWGEVGLGLWLFAVGACPTPLPFPLPTPSSRGEGDHSRAPGG